MTSQTDLTTGSVSRQLIRYALPVVGASILQTVYSITDLLVVSHLLGDAGASGVSNGSQVILMVTKVAIGLSNGGNILVGQYFGSRRDSDRDLATGSFLLLFALAGLAATLGIWCFTAPITTLMRAPAWDQSYDYLRIASLGLFFVFVYNCAASILRAVGNSRWPMVAVFATAVANIGLDLLFVGPLNMGTAGAAWATVAAQGVACLMALGYIAAHRDIFSGTLNALRLRWAYVKEILRLGIPCAIQMTVAAFSWLTVTYLINGYGVAWSAASAYSIKIKDTSMMFISALSVAASSMIAQTLGAGKFNRAKEVMRKAMLLSATISVVLVVFIELTAPWLARLFTSDGEVIAVAALNMRIEIIGQMFYAIFMIYHSLMTGAGDTGWVLFSSFVNCILLRFILSLIFNQIFGGVGIFVACAIAPASSIPVGWYYTRSGRWRKSLAAPSAEQSPLAG